MLYGLLASLSHIGFLGIKECTVPYPNFTTFPASIQTEAEARALVKQNIIKDIDPKLVNVYQCDSATDNPIFLGHVLPVRMCSQWHNSTYDDPTLFRSLNLTDSDSLMYKNLGKLNTTTRGFDLNRYYPGSSDRVVLEPTIRNGLAVLPHKTGVKMVVGAPSLSKNQVVDIPKTMAIEVEIGCLPVGVLGRQYPINEEQDYNYDWFKLDFAYKPCQGCEFSGPEYLFEPLQRAADAVRELILPKFNMSLIAENDQYVRSIEEIFLPLTWDARIHNWYPDNGTSAGSDEARSAILAECADQVHKAVNAGIPSHPVKGTPQACGFFDMVGSWPEDGSMEQGHIPMVCASATAINMVSAKLEMDGDGRINSQLSRLPSDLNIVRANYYNFILDEDGEHKGLVYDMIQRFTLSDNPDGDLQHFIYQHQAYLSTGHLIQGAGSPGSAISRIGGAMVGAADCPRPISRVVDSALLSGMPEMAEAAAMATEWASGLGASFFLATYSMNGFAALDKPPLMIQSTGGVVEICYQAHYLVGFIVLMAPYLVGFITLMVAALVVVRWSLRKIFSSRIRDTKKWQMLHGGMGPGSQRLLGVDSNATIAWGKTDTPLTESEKMRTELVGANLERIERAE